MAKATSSTKKPDWTKQRKALAETIAFGTAGWMQYRACQGLVDVIGEDAAKFTIAELINSGNRFHAEISKRPSNWPENSRHRMDIQLRGLSSNSQGAYGYIEVKWPKANLMGWDKVRLSIVQDAVRALSTETANLNARLVVLGCTAQTAKKLFDTSHSKSNLEETRSAFNTLFCRSPGTSGKIELADLTSIFPKFLESTPVNSPVSKKMTAHLLAKADASIDHTEVGSIFVWQIKKYS